MKGFWNLLSKSSKRLKNDDTWMPTMDIYVLVLAKQPGQLESLWLGMYNDDLRGYSVAAKIY